ncbi:MAG: SNF2-related protein [Desulfatirhabdiaceae bacterium]
MRPDGYLWARTITCPYCDGLIPLSPNWHLAPNGTGVRLLPNTADGPNTPGRICTFEIVTELAGQSKGTVARGSATCPYPDCNRVIDGEEVRRQAQAGGMGEQLFAVVFQERIIVESKTGRTRKKWIRKYRAPRIEDLGKTIQAGMLLRQAWMAGKARRFLILAPAALLKQWQIELREKFNLNWPIYDDNKLIWYPSPALSGQHIRPVTRSQWHKEPFVIASSHLMRRQDRASELLAEADPWDLVVLDEAHHARRRGGGTGTDDRPNQLLRLMNRLKDRTRGLILLTATPMQVSPMEVCDLLKLLGLPGIWHADAFVQFFEYAAHPLPGDPEMAILARLFRAIEMTYGAITLETAQKFAPGNSRIKAKKILRALRDASTIPIRQLEPSERRAAVTLMKAHTPIRYLISRHTRELLRRYQQTGSLNIRIAERLVEDRFVEMHDAERRVYTEIEDYISSTYNNASLEKRTAIGFVMTIYRKRLASSFAALFQTLTDRKCCVGNPLVSTGQFWTG